LVNGITPKYWDSSGNYVNASTINDTISGKLGRAAGENVTTYAFNLGNVAPNTPANYTTSLTAGTYAINPASLVVTATAGQNKIYGTDDPIGGFTYSGRALCSGSTSKYLVTSGDYDKASIINEPISGKVGR